MKNNNYLFHYKYLVNILAVKTAPCKCKKKTNKRLTYVYKPKINLFIIGKHRNKLKKIQNESV